MPKTKNEVTYSKDELQSLILESGFDSLVDFGRNSTVAVGREALRLAVNEGKASSYTLFVILASLNTPPKKMVSFLREAGDDCLAAYIAKHCIEDDNDAFKKATDKILTKDPNLKDHFVNLLEVLAKAAKVNINKELTIFKKGKGK